MTFEELLKLVIETERELVEEATGDESRYGDLSARRRGLQAELSKRVAALRALGAPVERAMDGRGLR